MTHSAQRNDDADDNNNNEWTRKHQVYPYIVRLAHLPSTYILTQCLVYSVLLSVSMENAWMWMHLFVNIVNKLTRDVHLW